MYIYILNQERKGTERCCVASAMPKKSRRRTAVAPYRPLRTKFYSAKVVAPREYVDMGVCVFFWNMSFLCNTRHADQPAFPRQPQTCSAHRVMPTGCAWDAGQAVAGSLSPRPRSPTRKTQAATYLVTRSRGLFASCAGSLMPLRLPPKKKRAADRAL